MDGKEYQGNGIGVKGIKLTCFEAWIIRELYRWRLNL